MNRLSFLSVAVLLAAYGCGTPAYTDIAGTQTVPVGNGISVVPQIEWGRANFPGFRGTLWTIDGAGLDALLFFNVQPGRPMIERPHAETDAHFYQSSMLPDDVMELAAANLEKVGFQQAKTSNLRPAPFGTAKGFRFDMTFTTKSGLEMKAMALASQRNGMLDMILFMAPTEYYFGHYAPVVEKIFASVQVSG